MEEHKGIGGSYIKHPDGRVTVNEKPTADHPGGNMARDKDGKPVFPRPEAEPAPPAPAKKGADV